MPIGSPRLVAPGGQTIVGRWLPENTRVSVHHWSTYRSETNFKDADKFVPERWLKTDPRYANDAVEAHQPFGYGPRNCIGQMMARHEMRLILATMLFRYDLELQPESENWSDQLSYALWIKNPLMIRATPVAAQDRLNI